MRILHVIHRYYPARGGAEMLMEKFSNHLAAAGHEVQVVTSDALDFELFWDPKRKRIEQLKTLHSGVAVRRFPVRHLPLSGLAFPAIRQALWLLSTYTPVPLSWLHRISRFAPRIPTLYHWAEVETQPFDLVGAMTITFDPLVEAARRLARRQGVPYVVYPLTHLGAGTRAGQDPVSRFYTMRHQEELVKTSDALVALTPAESTHYQKLGVPTKKITISGPGVTPEEVNGGDRQRFRTKHGLFGPIILTIGAMSHDKGTFHVIDAVRQLWASGRQVELVLIGEVRSSFKRFMSQLPDSDRKRIHLLGPVDESEKRDALAAANLMALPSRTESFGTVYLEAWLYEMPVIGATTWGVMDVITNGDDGLLVPFGDTEQLVRAMDYLLDNEVIAQEMGQRGRIKVLQHHTWQQKCQIVSELYQALSNTGAISE